MAWLSVAGPSTGPPCARSPPPPRGSTRTLGVSPPWPRRRRLRQRLAGVVRTWLGACGGRPRQRVRARACLRGRPNVAGSVARPAVAAGHLRHAPRGVAVRHRQQRRHDVAAIASPHGGGFFGSAVVDVRRRGDGDHHGRGLFERQSHLRVTDSLVRVDGAASSLRPHTAEAPTSVAMTLPPRCGLSSLGWAAIRLPGVARSGHGDFAATL